MIGDIIATIAALLLHITGFIFFFKSSLEKNDTYRQTIHLTLFFFIFFIIEFLTLLLYFNSVVITMQLLFTIKIIDVFGMFLLYKFGVIFYDKTRIPPLSENVRKIWIIFDDILIISIISILFFIGLGEGAETLSQIVNIHQDGFLTTSPIFDATQKIFIASILFITYFLIPKIKEMKILANIILFFAIIRFMTVADLFFKNEFLMNLEQIILILFFSILLFIINKTRKNKIKKNIDHK
ncbi:MAG: hypothetical protein ACOC1O_01395 [bacterium]